MKNYEGKSSYVADLLSWVIVPDMNSPIMYQCTCRCQIQWLHAIYSHKCTWSKFAMCFLAVSLASISILPRSNGAGGLKVDSVAILIPTISTSSYKVLQNYHHSPM